MLTLLQAIRHRFDVKKGKWCHTATIVIIEQNPFAGTYMQLVVFNYKYLFYFSEGAMRKAYRMRDLSQVCILVFL